MAARSTRSGTSLRPVLYQLGRVGDRFTVGDGPVDLGSAPRPLLFGRRDEGKGTKDPAVVAVDDPWMSVRHARIVEGTRAPTTASGVGVRLFIEDLGSKNGVVVNGAASPRVPLIQGDIVETGRTFWAYVEERGIEPLLSSPVELGAMATWHPRLGQQLIDLSAPAASDHVLVTGPDGAGKGFLARTLHQVSRRDGRFLHLDCKERRPRSIVVDVFGAEGGPQGKLRDAGAGTLLLENVDALPPELQERLAEALRRRSIVPDGKTRPVALDMRLVATISRSASDANVLSGLRPGLRDVLSARRVDLPPLDERACDLGLLLDDFLSRAKGAPAIARDACRVLFRHRFPQHVRGFARVVEAAASLAVEEDRRGKTGTIELRHLPFCVAGPDAMRGLLAQAQRLVIEDDPELTGEVPILSATGDDGHAIADLGSDAFSSVIETDTEHPRLSLSSSPPRRPSTASAMESEQIWAEVEDVDNEALVAALKKAHGNVSAAARALGRPRALVLRWLRDLNLDPLSYR